jgi:hypothetical protein
MKDWVVPPVGGTSCQSYGYAGNDLQTTRLRFHGFDHVFMKLLRSLNGSGIPFLGNCSYFMVVHEFLFRAAQVGKQPDMRVLHLDFVGYLQDDIYYPTQNSLQSGNTTL